MIACSIMPLLHCFAERSDPQDVDALRLRVERLRAALDDAEEKLAHAAKPRAEKAGATTRANLPPPKDDALLASLLRKQKGSAEAEPPTKDSYPRYGYSIRLPILVGYDDNVLSLSNEKPRPEGLSHRDSSFIELNPSLTFTRTEADESKWTFLYNIDKYYFLEQADVNLMVHEVKLSYARKLTKHDMIEVTVGDQLRRIDEEADRNQILGNARLKHEWSGPLTTLFRVSFASDEYELPDNSTVDPIADRDGETFGVGLSQEYVLRKSPEGSRGDPLVFSFGYEFLSTNADGRDEDFDRHRLVLGLRGSPFGYGTERWEHQLHKLQMQAQYSHDFDEYRNKHSKAGARGFEFERSVNADRLSVTWTYPIERNLNWEETRKTDERRRGPVQAFWQLTYTYTRSDGNILGNDKDNHIIKAGVVGDF
jgi:hypothetical protein